MYGLFAFFPRFFFISFIFSAMKNLFDFITTMCYKNVHRIDWFEQRLKHHAIRMCSAYAVASCIQWWHITQLKLFSLLLLLELHDEAIENNRTKETMVKWNEDDLLVFRILIDERNERMNEITTTTTRSAHFVFVCIHVYRVWSRMRVIIIIGLQHFNAEYVFLSFVHRYHRLCTVPCVAELQLIDAVAVSTAAADASDVAFTYAYIDIYIFSHVTLK